MDDLLAYYGVDWVAIGLTMGSLHLLGSRRRSGFVLGVAASAVWSVFSVMAGSTPTLAANCVFLGMNLRGFLKWSAEPEHTDERVTE